MKRAACTAICIDCTDGEHARTSTHEIEPPKPLHAPHEVVDAILSLARDPQNDEIVGANGYVKVLRKTLVPAASKKLAAKYIHENVMEKPPPADDSRGNVRAPVARGTDVTGHRKKK